MTRFIRALILLFPLAGVGGCGDTPVSVTHELLVFWNEVCDNTLRITDDQIAQEVMKTQFKVLDKQREDIKERASKAFVTYEKRQQADDLENALLDAYYEIIATEKRVNNCKARLEALSKTSAQNNNILAVVKWIDERKDFNNISLGSFSPNVLDPKAPKQIGKGLFLPWPQREKTVAPQVGGPPQDPPPQ